MFFILHVSWLQNVREYKKEYHKDNNKIKVNRKLQVLIVEDDEVNQMVLSKAIKRKGHLVSTANNGVEALNLIKEKI